MDYLFYLPEQGGAGATDNPNAEHFSNMMPFLRKYYHFILLRTSAELLAAAFREALNEYIEDFALVFLVLLGRDFRL